MLVPAIVVIVAEALAGGVTLAGLTVHPGASTTVCGWVGVTRQVRSTAPLKPLSVPTVTVAKEEPPGSIAVSDSAGACSVKLWADAVADKGRKTASRHATVAAFAARKVSLDFDGSGFEDSNCNGSVLNHSDCGNRDFNMSRFQFK